jgi:hypothetical protein
VLLRVPIVEALRALGCGCGSATARLQIDRELLLDNRQSPAGE